MNRWMTFNLVGAGGVVVQLGLLALLVRTFHWHYLPATALAVEAAVLHNFLWHQRWTWRDRPAATLRSTINRLVRFHLLNGAISLGGNLALMTWLTGGMGLDAVPANLLAVAACSLLNFTASELAVFRSTVPAALALVLLAVPASAAPRPSDAAGPDAEALAGWRSYEAALDQRHAAAASDGPFFAEDRDPTARAWRDTATGGGVSMSKVEAPSIPNAKIHHWTGSIFVPGVTLDAILERLKRNAGHESEFYDDVTASRVIARAGDHLNVYMKLRRTTLITVSYNTEHAVDYRRVSAARASARSVATRIAEIEGAGTAAEREKPASDDSGFLWRLNAYWRYEAVPGGVLVECESVSLSRAVPYLVRPLANPMVDRIARESLERTLRSLRTVLTRQDGVGAR
ncbi:MAG: GtrA family protein [Acidobacteriota bacterium]